MNDSRSVGSGLALAIILVVMTGCASSDPAPVTPPKNTAMSNPGPSRSDPAISPPAVPSPLDEPELVTTLCSLAQTYGNPPEEGVHISSARWTYLLIGGDCRVELPVGGTSLLLTGAWAESVAKSLPGVWEPGGYRVDLDLELGQWQTVEIPELARLTVLAVAEPAFTLEAAHGPEGPWRLLQGQAIIEPDEHWLRLTMHRSVPEEVAGHILMAERYGAETLQATRTQFTDGVYLYELGTDKPVLYARHLQHTGHLPAHGSVYGYIYRTEFPQVITWTPMAGERSVLQLLEEPYSLQLSGSRLRYKDQPYSRYAEVDLVTGQLIPGGPPGAEKTGGDPGPWALSYSSDGRLAAGTERYQGGYDARKMDLVLFDWRPGQYIQRVIGSLNLPPISGCRRQVPDIGWRPDSVAFAVLNGPHEGLTELLLYDVAAGSLSTLQSWQGSIDAFDRIGWSPEGQYIAAGRYLVQASTGEVIREDLMEHVHFSPDGRHLLMMVGLHPFTHWGLMAMIDLTTGERIDLGIGAAVGWTPAGEAVYIKWPFAEQIPPPGKGCLP